MNPITVIYHAHCNDGFCSAWLAWEVFGDRARYVPANYGDPIPEIDGHEVYILDFSYPLAKMEEVIRRAKRTIWIDHHISAITDLRKLHSALVDRAAVESGAEVPELVAGGLDVENFVARYNVKESGASLTLKYLRERFPEVFQKIIPSGQTRLEEYVRWVAFYVKDRDLWSFALPRSKVINSAIQSWPLDFQFWHDTALKFTHTAELEGEAILRYVSRYVETTRQNVRVRTLDGFNLEPQRAWQNAAFINAPKEGISELLNEILIRHPEASFACGWHQKADGKFYYSLRGRGDVDVSEIARAFGGGGHHDAAGFVSDTMYF